MGRFWDGRRLLIGIKDVEIYTLGERGFLWRKKTGQVRRERTVTEERVRVAGTGISSVTGQSGDRSWAGGMFTNNL